MICTQSYVEAIVKRITVLFDDEELYRELKAEAAKEGRSVKDVVAEALSDWLRRSDRISPEQQRRGREALRMAEELLASQRGRKRPPDETIQQMLDEMREERP
jgi:hypothetical protein